ncbi:hypothetical protein [Veronia pacifica]|uniref:hypothetical protein n=1 Tax=Veronia pacifica TaxID=1080227 RepID=UPI001C2FF0DD|nr:hypothetical protein [Veronia pacifica]
MIIGYSDDAVSILDAVVQYILMALIFSAIPASDASVSSIIIFLSSDSIAFHYINNKT